MAEVEGRDKGGGPATEGAIVPNAQEILGLAGERVNEGMTKILNYSTFISGIILMVWYFIEWFNHVQGPYPMEGQPPSGWLTFYAMLPLSLVCFSAIYGCMIWYAPVPLFLAGLVNIIWPLLMFNSWYGEMSWSYWSCWMVGGSLNLWVFFIPPILAGLIYWATQHNENLKDAPYYILATTTFVISSIWYTEDWII